MKIATISIEVPAGIPEKIVCAQLLKMLGEELPARIPTRVVVQFDTRPSGQQESGGGLITYEASLILETQADRRLLFGYPITWVE